MTRCVKCDVYFLIVFMFIFHHVRFEISFLLDFFLLRLLFCTY